MRAWLGRILRRPANLGDTGERHAADFLSRLGYKIVARQHSSRIGEIDLIAMDGQTIVFVEVKTRRTLSAGAPVEAVTARKQAQLSRAALVYLKRNGLLERRTRFDVVGVLMPDGQAVPAITHYRDAFTPTGSGQMFA